MIQVKMYSIVIMGKLDNKLYTQNAMEFMKMLSRWENVDPINDIPKTKQFTTVNKRNDIPSAAATTNA